MSELYLGGLLTGLLLLRLLLFAAPTGHLDLFHVFLLGLPLRLLLRLLDRLFRLLPLGRLIPLRALLRTLLRGFVSLGAAR